LTGKPSHGKLLRTYRGIKNCRNLAFYHWSSATESGIVDRWMIRLKTWLLSVG